MITEFSLENFRVFRDKTTFKIKPITILTGPNNSGKSSVNKALLLMKNTLENLKDDRYFFSPTQILSHNNNLNIGDIEQFANFEKKDQEVTFSITYTVPYFSIPIKLEYSYKKISMYNEEKIVMPPDQYLLKSHLTCLKIHALGELLMETAFDNDKPFTLEILESSYETRINFVLLEKLLFHFTKENYINDRTFEYGKISPLLNQLLFIDLKLLFGMKPLSEHQIGLMGFYTDRKLAEEANKKKQENLLADTKIKEKLSSFKLIDQIIALKNDGTKSDDILKHLTLSNNGKEVNRDFLNRVIEEIERKKVKKSQQYFDAANFLPFLSEIKIDLSEGINSDNYFRHVLKIINTPKKSSIADIESNDSSDKIFELFLLSEYFPHYHNYSTFLIKFANAFIRDIFFQTRSRVVNIEFISSVQGADQRIYNLSEPSPMTSALKLFFTNQEMALLTHSEKTHNNTRNSHQCISNQIAEITNGFALKVEYNSETNSFIPYLIKGDVKRNLNDFGTGIKHLTSIIIKSIRTKSITSFFTKDIFILEEPETFLHPALQSKLADLFTKTFLHYDNFLIETHSEYIIRKLQYLVAKGECNPDDVVIYYIDDPDPERRAPGAPQVREITLDRNGRMSHDFGPGFFDEADNLAIQLFNINQNSN